MARFVVILVVLGLIVAGAVEWFNFAWKQPGPPAQSGGQTVVMIAPGASLHQIAEQLEGARVVEYGLAFELDLRLRKLASQVKAGEYAIPSRASMADIADILISGKSIQHRLTAAEGLTSAMIYKLVVDHPDLVGEAGPEPAEGTLLPETYLFTTGMTRRALLDRMRTAHDKFMLAQWVGRAEGLPFTTMNEAVTLASIVEKETALPEERRRIAAVFVNRLRAGMRLQSDPTIIYGLTKGYPLGHGIRQSELESATPFNTYVIAGLPPSPISNPGKDSLAAVLNPASGDDLFFVADGSGGHVFAASLSEHARNVAAWRAHERMQARQVEPPSTDAIAARPPRLR